MPSTSTGGVAGVNASAASSASVYASSPLAHPALHTRMVADPAARAVASSRGHAIASSCARSRTKVVSWTVTSSISRSTRLRRPAGSVTARRNTAGSPATRRSFTAARSAASRAAGSAIPVSRRTRSAIWASVPFIRGPAADSGRSRSRQAAISSGASTRSTPRSMAAFGIPNTAEDSSSWAIASPPARRTAAAPRAPSLPIPVSTTATPVRPAVAAMLSSSTSPDGRCGPERAFRSSTSRPSPVRFRCAPSGATQAPGPPRRRPRPARPAGPRSGRASGPALR